MKYGERDHQSIVNQLVSSIPKNVLLRTSYVERQQLTSTKPTHGVSVELKSSMVSRVQFVNAKKEYEPCSEYSSGDETLSWESTQEQGSDKKLFGESGFIMPSQDNLAGSRMPGTEGHDFVRGAEKHRKKA